MGVDEHSEWGANPATLLKDGVNTAGKTSLTWEAGKPVLTFPIPGVPGATATATLDSKYMAERVVVKSGPTTYEFTYGDYKDWNNPLNRVQAYYAGKITEKRDGAVVRDLTTQQTETGSVYVVMPVPASVKNAITVTAAAMPERPLPTPTMLTDDKNPTPRLGERTSRHDGKLDCGCDELALRIPPVQSDGRGRVHEITSQIRH